MANSIKAASELPHIRAGLGEPEAAVARDGSKVVLEIGGATIEAPNVYVLMSLLTAGEFAVDRARRESRRGWLT